MHMRCVYYLCAVIDHVQRMASNSDVTARMCAWVCGVSYDRKT